MKEKKRGFNIPFKPKPGKIKVIPSKNYRSQTDLSLAYSPGVAHPCLEIDKNPDDVYIYT